jgi:hypothetical protein
MLTGVHLRLRYRIAKPRRESVRKTAKLAVLLAFTIALAGAIFSTFQTTAQLAGADGGNPQLLANRLGGDDGFALVLNYSGDYEGSLETCG